jgi:uncharacterized FlaG/YvyC family protein
MTNGVDSIQAGSAASLNNVAAITGEKANRPEPNNVSGDVPAKVLAEVSPASLVQAAVDVEKIVNRVSDSNLSFSVDEVVNRMVVTVTAVGSDEIVRQFPPEEFLTVAKFIAEQSPADIDEDFLKGILFDQYS